MFMSQISPSIHFLSYTIFVRCFVSRLYQPSKMYWVGYPLFIFSGRVCNIGTVSPLTVWQNIPVRPSGPAVFFVEYFLSYGFHFLNSYRIVEVFCFCVTFDKSYFSRNFPIASKMSFFFFWHSIVFSIPPEFQWLQNLLGYISRSIIVSPFVFRMLVIRVLFLFLTQARRGL